MPYQNNNLPPSDPESPDYEAWREECRRAMADQRRLARYAAALSVPRAQLQAYAERHGLSMERIRERLHDEERRRYAYSPAVQQRLLAEAQAEIEARERLAGESAGTKGAAWAVAMRRDAEARAQDAAARLWDEKALARLPLEHLSAYEVKALPSGVLTGYLAVFNTVDAVDDIIQPGAFSRTVREAKARGGRYLLPLLYQHDATRPIGGFTDLTEDSHGLRFTASVDRDTRDGADAWSGIHKGYLSGMSIGYKAVDKGYDSKGRLLKAIALREGSVVTLPAHPDARILSVA